MKNDQNLKPCPSFPGYSASESGEIISHRKRRGIPGKRGGTSAYIDDSHNRPLKPFQRKKGYLNVSIMTPQGKIRPVGVHRLVADAFLGPIPEGAQVRHLDDCPSNNVPENLAYGDALDNAGDRQRLGGYLKGSSHQNSKLSSEQVQQIRGLRKNGEKVKDIAARFKSGISTIESIIYGKSYK